MTRAFLDFDTIDHCPGCGSAMIGLEIEPDIGRCQTCELYFRNPRPTQAEIIRSYDTGETFAAWQNEEPARAAMWNRRAALIQRFQAGENSLMREPEMDDFFAHVRRTATTRWAPMFPKRARITPGSWVSPCISGK